MKPNIIIKESKKNSNNNNFEKVTTFKKRSQVLEEQKGLFGKPIIKTEFKLNKNQLHLLEIFNLNPEAKLTRNILADLKSIPMHINTISNFIKESEKLGFITKQRTVKGTTINNAYFYQTYPDTFEDGLVVKDKRAVYYSITKLGKEVCALNGIKIIEAEKILI